MTNDSEIFEFEDRYCPICGNFIKAGSDPHRCLDKDLKRIEEENRLKELEELNIDRSYDDKFDEFDEFYNQDNYYDKDLEEE